MCAHQSVPEKVCFLDPETAGSESPLLRMKIAPPVRATNMLDRPQLLSRLTNPDWRVCLISAPAGWGKTSLVAGWQAEVGESALFAFLRVDDKDDSSPLFWTYLIAALREVHPTILGGEDAALRTPGMNPMQRIVPQLINELSEVDTPTVLVIDDYHLIGSEEIHSSLGHFIDHLPPQVRLVIATRSDPLLPLSRLRASGGMLEIRASDLGFSSAEAAVFLDRRFSVELDDGSAESLRRRTEGWPAGVQLAGLSLAGDPEPSGFIDRFAGDDRNVADYLVNEVFRAVTDEQRDFLLRTSVLDRMNASLCNDVAGVDNSAEVLENLERANLFLIPLDSRRDWYRYHHLFQDWLRYELERNDPQAMLRLHARASAWYEENGPLENAIDHSLAAREFETAAGLIDRYLTNWDRVHWAQASQWFDRIPEEVTLAHTMCAIGRARSSMARGDFSGGWDLIEAAESAAQRSPGELQPAMQASAGVYRAFAEMVMGDLERARALAVEIADQERAAQSSLFAAAAGVAGMSTFWAVGALESIPLLREASVARAKHSLADNSVTPILAAAYAEIGDWEAAETAAQTSFGFPAPPDWYQYPEMMAAHYAAGKALVAGGSRDVGIQQIREGLEMARGWIEPLFIAYGCLVLADALTEYSAKRALVREARQILEPARAQGRVIDLVVAAERKLALRTPAAQTEGSVYVAPLTDRERDVLRLLNTDLSLREIASELFVSHNTVKGYTKSIYRKLGVSSRASAVEAAVDLDL